MIWFILGALVGVVLLAVSSDLLKQLIPRFAHEPLSIGIDQRGIGAGFVGSSRTAVPDNFVLTGPRGGTGAAPPPSPSPRRGGERIGAAPRDRSARRGINENTGSAGGERRVGASETSTATQTSPGSAGGERSAGASETSTATRTQTDRGEYMEKFHPLKHLHMDGDVLVPDRVYAGQNFRLQVEVTCSRAVLKESVPSLTCEARPEGGGYNMQIELPGMAGDGDTLEVQVMAAGATLSPDAALFMPLEEGKYVFDWSCCFAKSETQTMMVSFLHRSGNRATKVGGFDHTIRVVQFAGFTERQLRAMGYVVRGVGGVLTIVGGTLSVLNYFGISLLT